MHETLDNRIHRFPAQPNEVQSSPSCPLCDHPHAVHEFCLGEYPLHDCPRCGLQFLDPQPLDATLQSIYSASYFLGVQTPASETRVKCMKQATASLYLDALAHLGCTVSGNLLEIGCGRGEFLIEAQSRGFNVTGIEISAAATHAANSRLRSQRCHNGTIETVPLPDGIFDVIALIDAIEHVRDPKNFLSRVHRLLKPGGIIFIVTPSLDSWSARVMRRHWMEYKVEHLFYFRRKTMRFILGHLGYGEIVIHPNSKVLNLDYIYHHFLRFPVPILSSLLKLTMRVFPERFTHRQITLPASSMIAMGRRIHARTAP